MPWNNAANREVNIGTVVRFNASDRVANHEWRDLCRKLKRFLHSRELSAELMRVLRRTGPNTHESKHILKACEFSSHEVDRFLKRNGLDVAMNVFSRHASWSGRAVGAAPSKIERGCISQAFCQGVAAAAYARSNGLGR